MYILGIIGVIAFVIMSVRIFRNLRRESKSQSIVETLKDNPEIVAQHLSKMIHMPWYVNMDQIPQWNSAIRGMPETFRIGGFANINHWQIINANDVFMVVVGEHSVRAPGLTNRNSVVNEIVSFNVHLRVNHATGNYEMRTRMPDSTEEKSVMANFGRKFFEALKERK